MRHDLLTKKCTICNINVYQIYELSDKYETYFTFILIIVIELKNFKGTKFLVKILYDKKKDACAMLLDGK